MQMKRLITVLIMHVTPFVILGSDGWKTLQPDTIDLDSRKRLYFEMPEYSIKFSTQVYDCHGFVVMFPWLTSSDNIAAFAVDKTVMNRNWLIYTDDVDTELWNTFNKDHVGSRCFIKNGLYYRVDEYYGGCQIYYQDVPEELFDMANDIMRSVYTRPVKEGDPPLFREKRKIVHQ